MEQQKAIAYIPQTLASKIEGADHIYSLPYVDNEMADPTTRKQMQDLIKAEMRAMRAGGKPKKNYLEGLPLPSLPLIVFSRFAPAG